MFQQGNRLFLERLQRWLDQKLLNWTSGVEKFENNGVFFRMGTRRSIRLSKKIIKTTKRAMEDETFRARREI